MFGTMKQAESVFPCINLGALCDQATGDFYFGPNGEVICNGGLWRCVGIGGLGNSFKTAFLLYMQLTAMNRSRRSGGAMYETETALMIERVAKLSENLGYGKEMVYDMARYLFTDKSEYQFGNNFWTEFKKVLIERDKETPEIVTTPFCNPRTGDVFKVHRPMFAAIDSFSKFGVAATDKLDEKEAKQSLGESGRNMEAMHDGRAKAQLMGELPGLTAQHNLYMLLTAHVGEEYQLDPMKPVRKQFQHMRQGIKFKGVGEQFKFLTNVLWFADGAELLINQGTKEPEFPESGVNYNKKDPDLTCVHYTTIRNKGNSAGMVIPIIFSQGQGLLPGLTEFYYAKKNKFGFGGNDRNYYYELLPDCKLSRTTVRDKLREDEKLKRAAHWTAEICQLQFFHPDKFAAWGYSDLEKLYGDIKEQGYDWDLLYNTRSYWVFKEDEIHEEKPYLHACDLLRMAKGYYRPKWYDAIAEGKDWRTTLEGWKPPKEDKKAKEEKAA